MLYRRDDGLEQAVEPGTVMADVFDRDDRWSRVDGVKGSDTSPMPALERLTRDEVDAIAEDAGVDDPGQFSSKAKVIDAIRDQQDE